MADIEFECPHCQHILVVDERGAGKQVPCPDCGKPITIPVPVAETQDQPVESPSTTRVANNVSHVNKLMFKCQWCGQSLEAEDDMAGYVIACPSCNRRIKLPSPANHRRIKIPSSEERIAMQSEYRRLHERSVETGQEQNTRELRKAERDLERIRWSRERDQSKEAPKPTTSGLSDESKTALKQFGIVVVVLCIYLLYLSSRETPAPPPSPPTPSPSSVAAPAVQQEASIPKRSADVNDRIEKVFQDPKRKAMLARWEAEKKEKESAGAYVQNGWIRGRVHVVFGGFDLPLKQVPVYLISANSSFTSSYRSLRNKILPLFDAKDAATYPSSEWTEAAQGIIEIERQRVSLFQEHTFRTLYADNQGLFAFHDTPPGEYLVFIEGTIKNQTVNWAAAVSLGEGKDVSLDFGSHNSGDTRTVYTWSRGSGRTDSLSTTTDSRLGPQQISDIVRQGVYSEIARQLTGNNWRITSFGLHHVAGGKYEGTVGVTFSGIGEVTQVVDAFYDGDNVSWKLREQSFDTPTLTRVLGEQNTPDVRGGRDERQESYQDYIRTQYPHCVGVYSSASAARMVAQQRNAEQSGTLEAQQAAVAQSGNGTFIGQDRVGQFKYKYDTTLRSYVVYQQ